MSVRKIADSIEYTPPVLYEYFESKDRLLDAVRSEGFDTLNAEFRSIRDLYRSPEKQLNEVAMAIWNFASQRPEVFQVMFNIEGAHSPSKSVYLRELATADNPVWDMIAAYKPRFADAVSRTYQEWWVVTYGFIILKMTVALPKESNGFSETLYIENVRRYLRSIL